MFEPYHRLLHFDFLPPSDLLSFIDFFISSFTDKSLSNQRKFIYECEIKNLGTSNNCSANCACSVMSQLVQVDKIQL